MHRYLHFIAYRAIGELKAEARRGYLGMLWWVVEPVIYMAAFYVVFRFLFHRGGKDAVDFLLIGLVVWKWFAASISMGSVSIMTNGGLIGQVYIPKWVFPATAISIGTIKFAITFAVLLAYLLATGAAPSLQWLSLPLVMGVQLMLQLAAGLFLAALVPFLPDLKLVIDNGLTLLFFLSGIFFDIHSIHSGMQSLIYLNPMLGIIDAYRAALLRQEWPDGTYLALVVVASSLVLAAGWWILRWKDREYPKLS